MLGNTTAPLVSTVKRRRTKGTMIKNVQISKKVNLKWLHIIAPGEPVTGRGTSSFVRGKKRVGHKNFKCQNAVYFA
jgi:hypothetical protein